MKTMFHKSNFSHDPNVAFTGSFGRILHPESI